MLLLTPKLNSHFIDKHALGIVHALQKQGHTTYLVGGCVRDLLINIWPKDFDIGTSALPEEIKKVIYQSYIIGRRFRLVLVKRGLSQFEVATFRSEQNSVPAEENSIESPILDNYFGSPEEDAHRRDFTINGLFYDPVQHLLIDYPKGIPDLENRWIRMIGEPNSRLIEDPIRILRAIRLAHKLDFRLDPALRNAIAAQGESLKTAALPRKREEWLKLLRLKNPAFAFYELYDLNLLKWLSPSLDTLLQATEAREVFLNHLARFEEFSLTAAEPVQLFGFLIQGVLQALNIESGLRSKDILEHTLVLPLMRDELGIFKSEQALIAKAFQLQGSLLKKEEFDRKGDRRRLALLSNESFQLALRLAYFNYWLPPADTMYWLNSFEQSRNEIEKIHADRAPIKKRGRRSWPKKNSSRQ